MRSYGLFSLLCSCVKKNHISCPFWPKVCSTLAHSPHALCTSLRIKVMHATTLIRIDKWMVCSRGARAFDTQHSGHEFESRSFRLKPEAKLLWGKGLFLIVKRVLRPYRWPRHCWAYNLHKQRRTIHWNLMPNESEINSNKQTTRNINEGWFLTHVSSLCCPTLEKTGPSINGHVPGGVPNEILVICTQVFKQKMCTVAIKRSEFLRAYII